MPQAGSLAENIESLAGALSAITGLGGDQGLGGAASQLSTSPVEFVEGFGEQFTQLSQNVMHVDTQSLLGAAPEVLGSLGTLVGGTPGEPLTNFQSTVQQVQQLASSDFVSRLQQIVTTVKSISDGVPQDRAAIFKTLLDQVLGVLGSLEGPEAEPIRAWIQSVTELAEMLLPVIQQAQADPNPQHLAVAIIEQALESTLDALGFGPVKQLVDFFDHFPGDALPGALLDNSSTAASAVSTAFADAQSLVDAGYPEFREAVVAVALAMVQVEDTLRPVFGAIRRVATSKILQPHALENFLREQMDQALGVQVHEVARIDDPFKALFDRIDEAIGQVDLSAVRTDVLGFFTTARDTVEAVDIPSVGTFLQEQVQTVDAAVRQLQQAVTDLQTQLRAYFQQLLEQARGLAGQIGTFQSDDSFKFGVEDPLRQFLSSARLAVAGDPGNPDSPSVAGTLAQVRTAIEQLLEQLNGLLGNVDEAIEGAVQTACNGLQSFTDYVQGLDLPALVEQLRQAVESIVNQLIPIDFSTLAQPVIDTIHENRDKLRSIDTESLNDLLREALKLALDVIINIDFTAAVSGPLDEQYAKLRAVPAQAIEQLQQRYLQAIAALEQLGPEQLLKALFSAFDIIERALKSLSITALLRPLDQLHQQYLQEPLASLKPSVLLQPVSEAFARAIEPVDALRGADLLAPIESALDELKQAITSVHPEALVDELSAAIDTVKSDMHEIRPSELLQPVVEEFARLESRLDEFSPSVVFQPVTQLATPLLAELETVQATTITALFEAFRTPLDVLDKLEPGALADRLEQALDTIIAAVESLRLPTLFNELRAAFSDLRQAAAASADPRRLALVDPLLDPVNRLQGFVDAYQDLLTTLRGLKANVRLSDLSELYTELRQRLIDMLPPYAQALLDPDTFKRLMRLADPSRFLTELDQRFTDLKNRLIPIRPQDIAAELDATFDSLLELVDAIDISAALDDVKQTLQRLVGIVTGLRVDFIAGDLDAGLNDLKSMLHALDPSRLFTDLDAIHHELELAVQSVLPSMLLAPLNDTLSSVQQLIERINPRNTIAPPIEEAWQAIEQLLEGLDFMVILSPILDKLDALEADLKDALGASETAFDEMLGAARSALGGSGGGSGSGAGSALGAAA